MSIEICWGYTSKGASESLLLLVYSMSSSSFELLLFFRDIWF